MPRLLTIERLSSRWCAMRRHLPPVFLTGAILLGAAVLPLGGLPFRTCTFAYITGLPCPFCGYTRALIGLAHGRVAEPLVECPAALPLFAGLLAVLIWNALPLLLRVRLNFAETLRPHHRTWIWGSVVVTALVLGNWIYRLTQALM